MTYILTSEQTWNLRARAQRLFTPPGESRITVSTVIAEICGVQAQDAAAAALALRARLPALQRSDIDEALQQHRSIVRTWCMRGTLHLLATADLSWLLALHGPVFVASSRRRRAQLGLDDAVCAKGVGALRAVLAAAGPLSRDEIVDRLASRGIALVGQAAYHLLRHAALQGAICFGPARDREPTYVVLDDRVKLAPVRPREQALVDLARRYLVAYGPASIDDLACWSGLPISTLRPGWRVLGDEIVQVDGSVRGAAMLASRLAWLDAPGPDAPSVKLIPAFDPYLLGYRDRSSVPQQYARRVHPGGGVIHPVVLVNGLAVATWRLHAKRQRVEVIVEPFARLPAAVKDGLEREAADVGRFLGASADLSLLPPAR